jgi:hypothetical protein
MMWNMILSQGFVFIEPSSSPTAPLMDELTLRATALLRACTSGRASRGRHDCTGHRCPSSSDNLEHTTPDGRPTHSLLVHYVACHRTDVSAADLEFLRGLISEEQPTDRELGIPDPRPAMTSKRVLR